jgi:hypothetical protein
MAASCGLEYHLEKAIVANSFLAHRLSHLAKEYAVQNELEEELFAAYFTRGENTAEEETLVKIGVKAGVPEEAIRDMFSNNSKTDEVNQDIEIAGSIGISGVPFFVFDRKYAVSGAQESETFLQVLNDVWEKEQAANN